MYKIFHTVASISLDNYIRNYRDAEKFIVYCRQCNRYNTCWSCPPFDFSTDEYISSYQTVHIIGTKIVLEDKLIANNKGTKLCTKVGYEIIGNVRFDLDKMLLNLEEQYPGSKAFFAGTCHICRLEDCTRIKGKPCIAPDRTRSSLESFGFDIGKTSHELLGIEMKWSADGILPEYFTLVSGLFTRDTKRLSVSDFENTEGFSGADV